MKKYVTASLFIFFLVTLAVSVAGLISYDKNKQQAIIGSNNNVSQVATSTAGGKNVSSTSLTLSSVELSKHNLAQSCWLLIAGKIYDVTTFINSHPGGDQAILFSCGKDATVAFDTKGGNGSHSNNARAMLADYYIGDLNQTVQTSTSNPTIPTIANPNAATQNQTRQSDREFDDD